MERTVNNAFYEDLADGWYEDRNHPIALLRAENAVRNPWILSKLPPKSTVLDIGCGAGLLTNELALHGHTVTGVDLSANSLKVAQQRDTTRSVSYLHADAFKLPYAPESFDVICAMDFLEHIPQPGQIIAQVARLLRPNGLFFFHTFNRNPLSWLLVIKGVEWCVPNTPPDMHLYSHFIKPTELQRHCQNAGMTIQELHGLAPKPNLAFWKGVLRRQVQQTLEFAFTRSLLTGYVGIAKKV
jgi:2-polyprenyl-6-hydroxyphenyl methylase/3-demethylubiquinone-9 3-methyltransferase